MARFVFALSAAAWMATVVSAVDHSVAGGALAPAVKPAAIRAGDAPQASQDAASPRALLDRVLCHLPQPAPEDRGPLARHGRPVQSRGTRRRLGEGRPEASCGHDAAGWPAPARQTGRGVAGLLARGRTRSGRRGEAEPRPRPASPPEPDRIRERHSRHAGARRRRAEPAARRRHRRARLRQRRRGADRLAGADGTVPVCRAQDRPARSRVPDRSRRGVVSAAEDAHPGRSAQRGSAVRIARRRRGAPLLPRGRRVQDQGQAEVEPLRLHPRPGTAAGSRRAARWRAREALHRRRPIGSESPAAQLLGRDARQHDLRDLRARCRRGSGSDGRGQGGHAHRRRLLYASDLGIRRRAAAGPDRLSARGQRAVRRPRRGRQHRDRRTVQDRRPWRYAQPPEDPALLAARPQTRAAERRAAETKKRARSGSCRRSPGAPIGVR